MAPRETRRSFGPPLAILFIIGGIYATIANSQRHDRPDPSSAPFAKQTPVSDASQKTSSVAKVVRTLPASEQPITPVPVVDAPPVQPSPSESSVTSSAGPSIASMKADRRKPSADTPAQDPPPVQSLDIDKSAIRGAEPPGGRRAAAPGMAAAAPTCEYLASYVRTNNLCGELDRVLCWSPGMVDFIQNRARKIGETDHLEIGNALASKRKFRQAIFEYTKELKSKPDSPEALMKRAAAYEAAGDKPAAIADYCRTLRAYSAFDQRAQALGRIAELSGLQLQKNVAPPPATSDTARPALPLPATGDIRPRRHRNAIAPFSIKTKFGANYLVKLVNVANVNDQIWIFIRGGQSYETKVPLGTYSLRLAAGDAWYGRHNLFGPDTRFFRLRNKRPAGTDTLFTLTFRREGNRVIGSIINFEGSVEGNLEQEAMTRAAFDAN